MNVQRCHAAKNVKCIKVDLFPMTMPEEFTIGCPLCGKQQQNNVSRKAAENKALHGKVACNVKQL